MALTMSRSSGRTHSAPASVRLRIGRGRGPPHSFIFLKQPGGGAGWQSICATIEPQGQLRRLDPASTIATVVVDLADPGQGIGPGVTAACTPRFSALGPQLRG